MLHSNTLQKYKLEGYVPNPYVKTQITLPPKIADLKFWVDPNTYKDFYALPVSPIQLRFVFGPSSKERSAATEFHLNLENVDTGEVKHYVIYADEMPFRLWEKYEEAYTNYTNGSGEINVEEIPNSIVNARVIITPMNAAGLGPNSVFFIPSKGLVKIDSWMQNKYPVTDLLRQHSHLLFPEEKKLNPKVMYIYLNTPDYVIERDKEELFQSKWWRTTPFNNWEDINNATIRWQINDNNINKKLTSTWEEQTEEEIEFLNLLIKTLKPLYMEDLTQRKIDFSQPHIFKCGVPNPFDDKDTFVIYIMKEASWQI